jgi:hypothetical protein
MKKYLLPILHLAIFLISITSFLWIDWKIVLAGFLIYELQLILFKGCLLSFWEFGRDGNKPKERFVVFYMKKLFPLIDSKQADIYLDYIIPLAVPILAIILQSFCGLMPLLKI